MPLVRASLLRRIAAVHFDDIVRGVASQIGNSGRSLFDPELAATHGHGRLAYVGRMACGEACLASKRVLNAYGIESRVWRNNAWDNQRYDHCFLWIDDQYIFDPTVRQFWQRRLDQPTTMGCPYVHCVHFGVPPIFVGTLAELDAVVTGVRAAEQLVFSQCNECKADMLTYWRFGKDISRRFDTHLRLESRE